MSIFGSSIDLFRVNSEFAQFRRQSFSPLAFPLGSPAFALGPGFGQISQSPDLDGTQEPFAIWPVDCQFPTSLNLQGEAEQWASPLIIDESVS
jgi:hypothetical protein